MTVIQKITLDTTYVLPFLRIPISVKGFDRKSFKQYLMQLEYFYIAELSLYEVKAKIFRLFRKGRLTSDAFNNFWSNWKILVEDEHSIVTPYDKEVDSKLNLLIQTFDFLDVFDAIIVASAEGKDGLLTEDQVILKLNTPERKEKLMKLGFRLQIMNWKTFKETLK